MPTETFLKLSEEKKEKIVLAAKKEFARVPFEETSIQKIVEQAGIARGSFYQYFTSKEDLLFYLLHLHFSNMESFLEKQMKEKKGDIFEVFLSLYDYVVKECLNKQEMEFFHQVFEYTRTLEDITFWVSKKPYEDFSRYEKLIDYSSLKLEKQQDVKLLIPMLSIITKKAILANFHPDKKEKARKNYLKQLHFLQYGVLKERKSDTKSC